MEHAARHQCLIYDGPPSHQLPVLAAMIKQKMAEGYRCLYLNSAPMVAGLRSYLAAMDMDIENNVVNGRVILSSEPTLSADGGFDIQMMLDKLEQTLDIAIRDGYEGLWVTGDMTWEFGSKKNFIKLVEYEYRLEKLMQKRKELCGICQYHKDTLPHDAERKARLTHPMIFINETISCRNLDYIPENLPSGAMNNSEQDK